MDFYVGMHHPHDAWRVRRAMVSVKRLTDRRGSFTPPPDGWMLDSGAFTELQQHGHYRQPVETYARAVVRWWYVGRMLSATAQDYMCEPFILARTGLSVEEHQRLTVERYRALRALVPRSIHIMPVLQGFTPAEYLACLARYGDDLAPGMWAGVGSVCKRQGNPDAILVVLRAIKAARPDLRLHGFGVKTTALARADVRDLLHSADSMAWSFAARRSGRDANGPAEAIRFEERINQLCAA